MNASFFYYFKTQVQNIWPDDGNFQKLLAHVIAFLELK